MHLKSWSLIYPGEGAAPELAPVYDLLSTVPYIPADSLALSLGGEKSFEEVTAARWKRFANRARLPEAGVLLAVSETLERVNASWWTRPERALIPQRVLSRIDGHIKTMATTMSVA